MPEKETSLYRPVRDFLQHLGYQVRGEVQACDLVAVRGDKLLIVELKLRFNLELILQAVERQKHSGNVYLAIPRPKKQDRRWAQIKRLCARLGLGLLTVHGQAVEVILEADWHDSRGRGRSQLLREFRERSGDYNLGGASRRPVVTAYREDALRIAAKLSHQPKQVRDIVRETGVERAGRILWDNHYAWFERVKRGVYRLSESGRQALIDYDDVVTAHRQAK
ncbi:MAG: hypothetical protein FH749_00815 [Firmicutes bacterium]|nr:hypothetical protein [Bacillota bacterium]